MDSRELEFSSPVSVCRSSTTAAWNIIFEVHERPEIVDAHICANFDGVQGWRKKYPFEGKSILAL